MQQLQPLRLTASAVRDFRACAFRYALTYLSPLDPRERRPVTILAFGEIVHAVLADFIRHGGRERVAREDLATLLGVHWRDEVYPDPAIATANFARALELVENFYDANYPPGLARELGVERRHGWARYHRGLMATGRIDRVCLLEGGTLELLDYKTGRGRVDATALAGDEQALFYRSLGGEAYRRLAPTRIVVTFYYLATGVPVTVDFDRATFEAGWKRIEAVAMAIRAGMEGVIAGTPVHVAFPPHRAAHCQVCPMRGHCEAMAGRLDAEGGAA